MVWFTTLLLSKIYVCTASYPLFNEPTENRDTSKWVSIVGPPNTTYLTSTLVGSLS